MSHRHSVYSLPTCYHNSITQPYTTIRKVAGIISSEGSVSGLSCIVRALSGQRKTDSVTGWTSSCRSVLDNGGEETVWTCWWCCSCSLCKSVSHSIRKSLIEQLSFVKPPQQAVNPLNTTGCCGSSMCTPEGIYSKQIYQCN